MKPPTPRMLIIFLLLLWAVPCGAADLLNFPPDCVTPGEKVEYAYRAQELLRFEHNVMSYWLHCGLTQDEYDNGLLAGGKGEFCSGVNELTVLGPKVKAAFPYRERITEADYINYQDNHWRPRQTRLEVSKLRTACKKDSNCYSAYYRLELGPGGMEDVFKKEPLKTSTKWEPNVGDISTAETRAISR